MDASHAAFNQIQMLGYSPDDVSDIILTHLDRDHSGGIDDFPNAMIHVTRREFEAATSRRSISSWSRYPRSVGARSKKWSILELDPLQDWGGFSGFGLPARLGSQLNVLDLSGHTAGHAGVLLHCKKKRLFHVGDAIYHPYRLSSSRVQPHLLSIFERLAHQDTRSAFEIVRRLRAMKGDVAILCSHHYEDAGEARLDLPLR